MAGTRWFSFGIRVVTEGVAQKFRQVGSDFHNMTEAERKDIARLTQEVRDLAKAEEAADKAHKAAAKAHKDEIAAARAEVEKTDRVVARHRAEIARIHASQAAKGKSVTADWANWRSDMDRAEKATKMAFDRIGQVRADNAKKAADLNAKYLQREQDALKKLAKAPQKVDTARNLLNTAKSQHEVAKRQWETDRGRLVTEREAAEVKRKTAQETVRLSELNIRNLERQDKLERRRAAMDSRASIRSKNLAIREDSLKLARASLNSGDVPGPMAPTSADLQESKARVRMALERRRRVVQGVKDRDIDKFVSRGMASGARGDLEQELASLTRGVTAWEARQVKGLPTKLTPEFIAEKKARIAAITSQLVPGGDVAEALKAEFNLRGGASQARTALALGKATADANATQRAARFITRGQEQARLERRRQRYEIQAHQLDLKEGVLKLERDAGVYDPNAPVGEGAASGIAAEHERIRRAKQELVDAESSVRERNSKIHAGDRRAGKSTSDMDTAAQRLRTAEEEHKAAKGGIQALAATKAAEAADLDTKAEEAVAKAQEIHARKRRYRTKTGVREPEKFEGVTPAEAAAVQAARQGITDALRDRELQAKAVQDAERNPARIAETARTATEKEAAAQRKDSRDQDRRDAVEKHLESTAQVRDMRHVRDAIKQHLWGSVQDLTMKFAMVAGAVNRFSHYISAAAEFHFKAQGLSTLLNAGRGTGQDIYGDYARQASYQTEVSPTAAVSRMGDLAAAGYSRSEIGASTEAIFNTLLAARGEVTESGAFDLGVSLHRAFGGQGRSMGDLLDTTVAAGNMLPMTVGKARDALQYAIEAGVTNGQSPEELLLMIGSVMPIVGTGSKAGTVTRNAINSLSKPKGMEILAGLGVHPRDDQGRMRPVMDTFMDITDALKDVQRRDFAGTYKDPFGKTIKPPEKQAALDALKMKMDELEFKLTGQRGGAIFAANERLPELAKGALRGTIYEGSQYQFKDPRDALAALRLGLEDTTGEARRMADELRKTSFMLGKSFQVSVEKFQTSLGTFMLPMRDTLMNLWKTALDGVSSMMNDSSNPKYGQPGGDPVGSSRGWNLLGSGAMYAVAVVAVKAVVGVMRSAYLASTLLNPAAIATMAKAMGAASAAGRTLSVVEAAAGVSGTGVIATAWGGFAAALPKTASVLSLIGGLLGPISLVAGGLYALHVATKASLDAVTDFSNLLRAQVQLRTDKSLAGIRAILAGLAAGRLQADAKG